MKYSYLIVDISVKDIVKALNLHSSSVKFDGRTGWVEIVPDQKIFIFRVSADGSSLLGTDIILKKDKTLCMSIELQYDDVLKKLQGVYGGTFVSASKLKTLNDEYFY